MRLWIGTEDAKGSVKAKAEIENPKEPAILMEALQTVVNRIAGAGTSVPGVRKVVE